MNNCRTKLLATLAAGLLATGGAGAADAPKVTVLVTGANRGIGLEYVRQYAARGYRIIATARDPGEAKELRALADANPGISVEKLDVTDMAQVDALAVKYKDQPIDILVNNAGYTGGFQAQMFGKQSDYAVFDQVLRTNTIGPYKVAEAFLPHLLASQQKKLVNVSSSEGSIGEVAQPRMFFYRASKAALNMEMRNIAIGMKGKGLAVAMINPGPVDTDMMKGLPKSMLRSKEDAVKDLIRITDQLNLENSGTFWNYDGKVLPW